jgi:DnaJ-class molecular chaperone
MKHHPDIDAEGSSKEEFSRICEAYDVLSNGGCWLKGLSN